MKTNWKILILAWSMVAIGSAVEAQVGLPVYSDYLSDNVFLIHPAAAGLGKGGKLRMTYRQQWQSQSSAPALQTMTYHSKYGKNLGLGGVVFNDRNGYHSQLGLQATFAYKLRFETHHHSYGSRDDLNQLTLAFSTTYVQQSVDQRNFVIPDPVITPTMEASGYANVDFGMAYHFLDGYAYLTANNLMKNKQTSNLAQYKALDRRRYVFNVGYFLGKGETVQWEPSIMYRYNSATQEQAMDINVKLFKTFGRKWRAWIALSKNARFDTKVVRKMGQWTPIIGIETKQYLVAYTHTQQFGDYLFSGGNYHQLTLGYNTHTTRLKNRRLNKRLNPLLFKSHN